MKLKDIQPYTIVRLERAVELLGFNRMVVTERYDSATNHYLCRPAGCADSIELSGDEEGEAMERINVLSGESQDD